MKTMKTSKFFRRLICFMMALALVLALAVGLFSTGAKAAGGLEMSTPYPGISAKPGDSLSFTVNLTNASGAGLNAALSTVEMPEGWSGYFTADGSDVSKVHVDSREDYNTASVTFHLNVAQTAEMGDYIVRLQADAGGGAVAQLDLELALTEEAAGENGLTVQYPEQEGSAGTAFSFSATLVNNYATEQSYSLSAEVPTGWSAAFTTSDSTQVASITIEPGQSQALTIAVTPAANAEAGDYTVSCAAVSGSETLKSDLSIAITEAYSLTLSTPSGNLSLDAQANRETTLVLSVTNTSNIDLENITLTSSAPSEWEVRFETSSIEVLEAGATQEVTAYVTPSSSAMSGDYVTEITASNSYASSTAQFRVAVKTSTLWGIVAVVIIVAVVLGLMWVFRKYGRR